MTIAEVPPIFLPAGKGFKASYNLTFSTDLNHSIYLLGGNQGDSVTAKSLMIDNSANSVSCSIDMRGDTVIVPAYTVKYINCKGILDVIVSAGNSLSVIDVDVLTSEIPEATINKKNLSVGGALPITYNATGNLGTAGLPGATKLRSIGDPISSYLVLFNAAGAGQLSFGNTNLATFGVVAPGNNVNVPWDCSVNEFWIQTTAAPTTYRIYGA